MVESAPTHTDLESRLAALDAALEALRLGKEETVIVGRLLTAIIGQQDRERTLRRREERLQLIVDRIPALITCIDSELKYHFVGGQLSHWLGRSNEELVGTPLAKTLDANTFHKVRKQIELVLGGQAVTFERWIDLPEIGPRYVHGTLLPHIEEQQRVTGVVAAIVDLTDRKRAEDSLQEITDRYQAILGSLHHSGIVVYDRAGVVQAFWGCPELDARYHRSAPDIVGHSLAEILFSPSEAAARIDEIRRVFDTGQSDRSVHTVTMPEGVFWHDTTLSPLRDANGQIHGVVAFLRDVTALKQMEQQTRLMASGMVMLQEGVFITEGGTTWSDSTIVFSNPAMTTIIGHEAAELCGMTPSRLLGARTDRAEMGRLEQSVRAGAPYAGENTFYCHDGVAMELALTVSPVVDRAGSVTHFVSTCRDMTAQRRHEAEQAQLRAQLVHMKRVSSMGEMATCLAHELSQPLGVITTYAGMSNKTLREGATVTGDLRNALEVIDKQAQHAGQIVHQMRRFLKRHAPKRKRADISQLVGDVLEIVGPLAKRDQIAISFEPRPGLPAVHIDPIQIQQVVLNLVRNALDAISDAAARDRRVVVRVDTTGEEMIVTVADTGPGMNQQQVKDAFKPYHTTKRDGLGMGLNISETILRAHGGHVSASRNDWGGMTFQMALPVESSGIDSSIRVDNRTS